MKTILSMVILVVLCFVGRSDSVLTESDKEKLLTLHNSIRSDVAQGRGKGNQPAAANMLGMVWNDELAITAQKWADKCDGEPHDAQDQRKGKSGFSAVGQNMMPCHHSQTDCLKRAMTAFYDEANGYTFDSNACNGHPMCTHYTQLAWAMSRFVGCGYNKCQGHASQRLVCNYGPAGNYVGQKAYEKGTACTKCLPKIGQCLKGLCFTNKDCIRSPLSSECKCSVNQATCVANGGTYSDTECFCQCPAQKAGLNCQVECKDSQAKNVCDYYKGMGFCSPTNVYFSAMKGMCGNTCNVCDSIPVGEENKNIKVNVVKGSV